MLMNTLIHRTCSVVLPVACASVALAQFQGPESVEYDPDGDRYFVSNTGSNSIKQQDQAGVVADFVTVSPAPYGLELMGDTLFACSGGSVKGYATSDGALVFNRALGGSFLNGMTTDGSHLYVTDFSSSRIYKVDVANNTHSTLVTNTGGTPNGIVWDPVGERLVVVFWGSNAPIKAFDRVTGASTTLVSGTGLSNIDGVTIDCFGNFLIASWSPDRITSYPPDFATAGANLGVPGVNNPADIDFDVVNGRVCIPNAGNNTVTLFEVDCATSIVERAASTVQLIPNPTSGLVKLDPPLSTVEPYMVFDARGLLVAGGTAQPREWIDLSALDAGAYYIHFGRLGHQVRVVKY
jgi:YVTN family beta-propeller protein